MQKLKTVMASAILFLGAGSQAFAQAQEQTTQNTNAQAPTLNSCDIELWVAKKYGYEGSSGGGQLAFGLLGALVEAAANKKGDAEKKSEMMEIIPPEFIKDVFLSTDLTTRLKKDAVQVNYHELSDSKDEINALLFAKKRSTENTNECYYEVYVKSIASSKYMENKNLSVVFKLKRFSGQIPMKVENETRNENLTIFPTKDDGKKGEAADDLRRAFRATVSGFIEKRFN